MNSNTYFFLGINFEPLPKKKLNVSLLNPNLNVSNGMISFGAILPRLTLAPTNLIK
jgi:hypothetical protein